MAEAGQARLLSLYVFSQARGAGWGTRLLKRLEEIHRSNVEVIWTDYASLLPQRSAFESTLRRAGWDPPMVREVRISGSIGPAIAAMTKWPGMDERPDRRRGITFEPWSRAAANEVAIEKLTNEAGFLPALAPALYGSRIDPSISLAIRQQQHLIGWVLGERFSDREIRSEIRPNCPTAYVTQTLWHTGVLIRAYFRSLLLAREAYGDEATAVCYAALSRLRTMALRRCNFFATGIEILQAMKRLG